MNDPFDSPPYGYARARKKGWLKPTKGPLQGRVQRLKARNDDLAAQLQAMHGRLLALEQPYGAAPKPKPKKAARRSK